MHNGAQMAIYLEATGPEGLFGPDDSSGEADRLVSTLHHLTDEAAIECENVLQAVINTQTLLGPDIMDALHQMRWLVPGFEIGDPQQLQDRFQGILKRSSQRGWIGEGDILVAVRLPQVTETRRIGADDIRSGLPELLLERAKVVLGFLPVRAAKVGVRMERINPWADHVPGLYYYVWRAEVMGAH